MLRGIESGMGRVSFGKSEEKNSGVGKVAITTGLSTATVGYLTGKTVIPALDSDSFKKLEKQVENDADKAGKLKELEETIKKYFTVNKDIKADTGKIFNKKKDIHVDDLLKGASASQYQSAADLTSALEKGKAKTPLFEQAVETAKKEFAELAKEATDDTKALKQLAVKLTEKELTANKSQVKYLTMLDELVKKAKDNKLTKSVVDKHIINETKALHVETIKGLMTDLKDVLPKNSTSKALKYGFYGAATGIIFAWMFGGKSSKG